MTSPTRLQAEQSAARSNAAEYERLAVPALFAGWATSLVDLASPAPGAHILDLGCGTGIVARTAAAAVGADGYVDAIDSDLAMLEAAREACTGVAASMHWHTADALHLPFDDAAFDIVFCQQALQFFEDPGGALVEMRRVVRPGGCVAVNTWRGVQEGSASHTLAATLGSHLGSEAAGELDAPCVLGAPDALGKALSDAGLDVRHTGVLVQALNVGSAAELLDLAALITSLGPWLADLGSDTRRRLTEELDHALAAPEVEGRLAILIEACVAVGRR